MPAMLKHAVRIGLVVAGASVIALAQGPRRDGQWNVQIEMNMPGMPAGMPPISTTQCVTPSDAADPQKAMPPRGRGGRGNSDDCQVSDYKTEGNKVTYTMKCSGAQPMTGTGEFVYAADKYTGTMTIDMQGRGSMTMKYTGTRVGDCTK
jgi:Protein of unknown function (DUF3617)